jgi:hypothetical protein
MSHLGKKTVRAMLEQTLAGMAGPRTALGDSIGLGIKLFEASTAQDKLMILLSDGSNTASRMPPERAAEIAKARGIQVDTIGIGDPKVIGEAKVDTATLRIGSRLTKVAEITGGHDFFGQDQAGLTQIDTTIDQLTAQNARPPGPTSRSAHRALCPIDHPPPRAAADRRRVAAIGCSSYPLRWKPPSVTTPAPSRRANRCHT